MRITKRRVIGIFTGALILTLSAFAQGTGRRLGGPGGFGGPGGPGFGGPAFGFGGGKVVTNAPYSGVGVSTFAQTLSNGNVITRSNCTKVYRDNMGRARQEESPNSATCSATPSTIVIRDPVAGVQYFINEQNKTYRQMTFKAPPAGTTPARPTRPTPPDVQTTNLPQIPILGTSFFAQGTQTVRTIPAGEIGNTQPITITSVNYYSPDLQIVVQTSRDDPRSGKSTYQLTVSSITNPDSSLFQLPSGLTQQQGRGGPHVRPAR